MKRIIFICSGNICRSPMAAVLAENMLRDAALPAVIISAGTLGLEGRRAAREAVQAIDEIGMSLTSHRSQGVSLPLCRMADHLVVMAPNHENHLLRLDPSLRNKIVRMWEFASTEAPLSAIDDPVNQPVEAFRKTRDLLQACVQEWIRSL